MKLRQCSGEYHGAETLLHQFGDLLVAQTVVAGVALRHIVESCSGAHIDIAVISGSSGIELSVATVVDEVFAGSDGGVAHRDAYILVYPFHTCHIVGV